MLYVYVIPYTYYYYGLIYSMKTSQEKKPNKELPDMLVCLTCCRLQSIGIILHMLQNM